MIRRYGEKRIERKRGLRASGAGGQEQRVRRDLLAHRSMCAMYSSPFHPFAVSPFRCPTCRGVEIPVHWGRHARGFSYGTTLQF